MTRADLMLFRRMRGVFWGLLLIAGIVAPALIVAGTAIPARLDMYTQATERDVATPMALMTIGLGFTGVVLTLVASVVLGATAGSVDLQRGVLRDLVLTGKPRWRIVTGRLLAAGTMIVAAFVVSMAIVCTLALLLSPMDFHGTWRDIAQEAGQYAYGIAYVLPLAAGVALLVGSRGPAIAVYFVVALMLDGILTVVPKLGDWWENVSLNTADFHVQVAIRGDQTEPGYSLTHALIVLAGWALIPFAIGLVRLGRRDL